MSRPLQIDPLQLERINRIETSLAKAVRQGDLKRAKLCVDDLRPILQRYQHGTRLLENYLILYEAALEAWELDLARSGFEFVIREASRTSRLSLEARTLLAITFLRKNDILSAEPHIADVLRNDRVIKSAEKRREFRREAIDRFDQEGAIAALAHLFPEHMDEAKVHERALKMLREIPFEDQLEEELGAAVPQAVKDFILKVDEFAKNQLPSAERLMLPGPAEIIKNRRVGSIVFDGVTRRMYRHLCDEDSEAQKRWVKGGINSVLNGGFLITIVMQAALDARIMIPAAAATISALVMKRGLGNFCQNHQPRELMSLRRKRAKAN